MATFKVTATTTVAELKKQFTDEFGGTLRVYDGRSEAPDNATLVSLGAKEGELECRGSRTAGKYIEAVKDELNIKVKVYTNDNWVAVLDGITLATVREIPNGSTKAKMEQYLSYQRDEKDADSESINAAAPEEDAEEEKTLSNPEAIYFIINSDAREITDDDLEGLDGFVAFRAMKDGSYVYGVWRYDLSELAEELGVEIADIEVFDMDFSYDSVENYPGRENIYLPQWLYDFHHSDEIVDLCPSSDAEPINAAIDCNMLGNYSNWALEEEVPCILLDANGKELATWIAMA